MANALRASKKPLTLLAIQISQILACELLQSWPCKSVLRLNLAHEPEFGALFRTAFASLQAAASRAKFDTHTDTHTEADLCDTNTVAHTHEQKPDSRLESWLSP